ncbi:MAG TPA: hypothetical protein DDW98_02520 [Gammaproteobacteria bacterium]|nr:hypothetical protein [Gammaproteobacteria bacterium]
MIYRDHVVELGDPLDPIDRGRFLVLGDVHGQMDMVMRLVRLIGYDPFRDRMIALGDLVDRGPSSAEALRWFAGGTLRTSLVGNHEAMMIDAEFGERAERLWFSNDGDWAKAADPFEVNLLRRLASGFPLAIRITLADGRRFGLVHGEVPPGASWQQVQRAERGLGDGANDYSGSMTSSLLWGRRRAHWRRALQKQKPDRLDLEERRLLTRLLKPVPGVDAVICGHTIMQGREPVRFGSHMFIDTGAYERPDGRLTAVDPAARVYWQVGHRKDEQWGPLPLPAPFEDSLPPHLLRRRSR